MDAAYAAGIMDGEGCLTIGVNKRTMGFDSRVYLGMTVGAMLVLQQFHKQFGGTLRRSRMATEKWAEAWVWCHAGKGLLPFLHTVLPHLTLKRVQARMLIELEEMKTPLPGQKKLIWNLSRRRRAIALRATVMDLNHKGPERSRPEDEWPGSVFVRDVDGVFLKRRTPDLIDDTLWEPFSGPFLASGTSVPGGWLMHKSSPCPNDGQEYSGPSLTDILEPNAPRKYWLSPKACQGILRRAEKRGRVLPPLLLQALQAVAQGVAKTPPADTSSPSDGTTPVVPMGPLVP